MFALADANSFYVSCERVFNSQLRNRPVVVLSNGDGCVISLKRIKIFRYLDGVPFFKIKDLVERKGVAVLSSNYTLYGDFSKRLMSTLQLLFPQIEVYSIDEAFFVSRRNGRDRKLR